MVIADTKGRAVAGRDRRWWKPRRMAWATDNCRHRWTQQASTPGAWPLRTTTGRTQVVPSGCRRVNAGSSSRRSGIAPVPQTSTSQARRRGTTASRAPTRVGAPTLTKTQRPPANQSRADEGGRHDNMYVHTCQQPLIEAAPHLISGRVERTAGRAGQRENNNWNCNNLFF